METRNVSVYWDAKVLKAVDALARRKECSRSELVNRICEESPEVKEFVSSSVVGGLGVSGFGMLYLVGWVSSLPGVIL